MIRAAADRFDEDLLHEAARRFDMDTAALTTLEGYENLVYADAARVLRISHEAVKDSEQVLSECRFIAYLAAGGARVAPALPSRRGSLLERLPDGQGHTFLATCFERAPGRVLGHGDDDPELIAALGTLVADMHLLSARYRPQGRRREAWHENSHIVGWRANTAAESPEVRSNIEALYQRLRALPDDSEHSGLIHGDLHSENVLWDGKHMTVIDFDDCLVGPWGMDLGTSVYYCRRLLPGGHERPREEQRDFILGYVENFVRGYCRARPLDEVARRHFADFVRWRQMDLFLYLHHSRATRGLDHEEMGYLVRMRAEIERGLSPLLMEDAHLLEVVEAASG